MGKSAAAIMLPFVLVLTLLSGCGSGYAQIWRCAYMDTGSRVLTARDLENAGTGISLDLRIGGIGYMSADGQTQKIGWTQSRGDDVLYLNVDGEREIFHAVGEALVWDMNGVSVTFFPERSEAYQRALEGDLPEE